MDILHFGLRRLNTLSLYRLLQRDFLTTELNYTKHFCSSEQYFTAKIKPQECYPVNCQQVEIQHLARIKAIISGGMVSSTFSSLFRSSFSKPYN